MGIGLYRRARDGAVFAIVAPKTGPRDGYLWQYRLSDDGRGREGPQGARLRGLERRREIEAIAVDDALGYVYYADEAVGIRKYRADPDAPGAEMELALFGGAGFREDREGLSIYAIEDGTGCILVSDQQPTTSVLPSRGLGATRTPILASRRWRWPRWRATAPT
jgi:3-phytase